MAAVQSRRPRTVTKNVAADPHFDEARLHKLALSYLNRFDASVNGLREVLLRKVRSELSRSQLLEPERNHELAAIQERLDALLERFQRSGLIDDSRLARHLVSSWRERGLSTRAISVRLVSKGVTSRVADSAIRQCAEDAQGKGSELDAAVAFAKRRRLGCFGPSPADKAAQRRDLARMSRAGFDFEVALRALNVHVDDESF